MVRSRDAVRPTHRQRNCLKVEEQRFCKQRHLLELSRSTTQNSRFGLTSRNLFVTGLLSQRTDILFALLTSSSVTLLAHRATFFLRSRGSVENLKNCNCGFGAYQVIKLWIYGEFLQNLCLEPKFLSGISSFFRK
jgi:hypothetical protein